MRAYTFKTVTLSLLSIVGLYHIEHQLIAPSTFEFGMTFIGGACILFNVWIVFFAVVRPMLESRAKQRKHVVQLRKKPRP